MRLLRRIQLAMPVSTSLAELVRDRTQVMLRLFRRCAHRDRLTANPASNSPLCRDEVWLVIRFPRHSMKNPCQDASNKRPCQPLRKSSSRRTGSDGLRYLAYPTLECSEPAAKSANERLISSLTFCEHNVDTVERHAGLLLANSNTIRNRNIPVAEGAEVSLDRFERDVRLLVIRGNVMQCSGPRRRTARTLNVSSQVLGSPTSSCSYGAECFCSFDGKRV